MPPTRAELGEAINSNYSDIVVNEGDNFSLVGKVVGLHRVF